MQKQTRHTEKSALGDRKHARPRQGYSRETAREVPERNMRYSLPKRLRCFNDGCRPTNLQIHSQPISAQLLASGTRLIDSVRVTWRAAQRRSKRHSCKPQRCSSLQFADFQLMSTYLHLQAFATENAAVSSNKGFSCLRGQCS